MRTEDRTRLAVRLITDPEWRELASGLHLTANSMSDRVELYGFPRAIDLAEREGFEPSIRFCRILTFQASAFDHSATAPQIAGRAPM